jgi:hypothetical protein
MRVTSKTRVLFSTNIPSPYQVERFNVIARRANVDLHVCFNERLQPDRSWDIEALQEKIALLYAHPELGREMGARARALIETRYTWGHWRENVRRAYEAILEGRDPKQAVEEVGDMPPSHAEEGGPSSGVSATRRVA